MIPRVYVDTSVFGGVFDAEWAHASRQFFEQVRQGLLVVVVSDLTAAEISTAPPRVRQVLADLSDDQRRVVAMTPEAATLADRYVQEKVIGGASLNDALHIATATVHRLDGLVSWNFKHIVNVERIHGYNSVNLRLGYPQLEIRTPTEVLRYDTP